MAAICGGGEAVFSRISFKLNGDLSLTNVTIHKDSDGEQSKILYSDFTAEEDKWRRR